MLTLELCLTKNNVNLILGYLQLESQKETVVNVSNKCLDSDPDSDSDWRCPDSHITGPKRPQDTVLMINLAAPNDFNSFW